MMVGHIQSVFRYSRYLWFLSMNYLIVLCGISAIKLATTEELGVPENALYQNQCGFGYKLNNSKTNTCEPMCEPTCVNSTCTEPTVCTCFPGFSKTMKQHECVPTEPLCKVECVTSNCIKDGKCMCYKEFTNSTSDPTDCECPKNYTKSTKDKLPICQPICDPPCVRGKCTAPGKCVCDHGFSNRTGNVCNPLCSNECVNSTCVRDSKCQCDEGYEELDPYKCRPSCWTCSPDECVKPHICACPEGSTKLYLEPNVNERWSNKTVVHSAFCIPSSNLNTTETSPVLAGLIGGTSTTTIVTLILVGVVVVGTIVLFMILHRRRSTDRVNNRGGRRIILEEGERMTELRPVSADNAE